jgi:two-component system chemotaxis sensor kinase CheA
LGRFIFHPGISTADKVTNVSGRGVGMDVVKTNIEKIGGTVDLKTAPGKGTSFQIKIPLTLAIVSALIVECAGEKFAVPQIGVVELVHTSPESEHKIEVINRTPVVRLRNRLLPLIFLAEAMRLVPENAPRPTSAFIIVAQVGTQTFGIAVDRVFDTEEIVVKPVASILRDNALFSGNTILGDGSVIMILDPNGLAQRTGEALRDPHEAAATEVVSQREADTTSLLVFRAGGAERKAVPLALVARLEEIEVARIEQSNGRPMVQYRGKLMPLVGADPDYRFHDQGGQPVIVFADGERAMGLAVDEIIDIVDDRLDVELKASRPGLIGTAVVAGQATGMIDVAHYLTLAYDDWFHRSAVNDPGVALRHRSVLLVDDSPFFRNMIVPVLSVAGYDVTTSVDADAALKLRDQGAEFDLIVSDIEMPGMDGFEFAATIRREGRWRDTPIIALSSRTAPADFERGRKVGFVDYIAKGDRAGLLESLRHTLDGRRAA